MTKENKMGVMPIPKLVLTVSLPIMVSMLVQSLYNIVDSIFVAKINEEALTSISIAYSAQILQIAVAVGTGVGVNSLVSRKLGAKKFDEANTAATTGLILTLLSSALFILWGIFGTEAFISLFTSNSTIVTYGTSYLQICQLFSTGIFLGTLAQRLLQSTGQTFSSMLAQLSGAVVNLILDPLLIFGVGFFPEMGIQGAAIATVIGQWFAAVVGLILNHVQNKEVHFVFKGFRLTAGNIAAIYKVGAPTILTQAIGSIMVAVMNRMLGVLGDDTTVAFFGVYFKLQSFLIMPLNGLGQGSLPIVGYNFGAKKGRRILQTCRTSISIGIGIALAGTLIFTLLTRQLLLLFSAGSALLGIGIPALRIISVTFVFAAVTMIIGYTISGLGNGMVNMIGTAIRQLVVLLPSVFILAKLADVTYCWYGFWIAEAAACLFAALSLRREYIRKIRPLL